MLLQLEISTLERSRSVMAEELVRLTNQNDEMEEKVKEIPKLKIQLKVRKERNHDYADVNVHQFLFSGAVHAYSSNLSGHALQDLEQRHNTILQMYGEKAEEAEELRLDLEDVKNMYKTQIDELLQNQK